MPNTILKRWNGTSFEELYPKTTVTQISASGTPSSTTFLRGDGQWQIPATQPHTHSGADITSGKIDENRLGSNSPTSTKYLRGDGSWQEFAHTHGDISNAGIISSTAVAPATGDYLLITDTSNSNTIKRSIEIGTATTTFLRNDGTWATVSGGTGTVTSVGITAGTGITVSDSPITTSGSMTVTNSAPNATHTGDVTGATALTIANDAVTNGKMANMAVNTIKGRITTGTGDPEDLTATQVRTILNVANGATANTGTVTSVALSLPNIFSISGSPVTTSGTLTGSLASQTGNRVFASPSGTSGTPTFRSLVAADIPNLDAAKITSGTFNGARIPNASSNGQVVGGVKAKLSGTTLYITTNGNNA
jgi:hypothetical protein